MNRCWTGSDQDAQGHDEEVVEALVKKGNMPKQLSLAYFWPTEVLPVGSPNSIHTRPLVSDSKSSIKMHNEGIQHEEGSINLFMRYGNLL